MPADTACWTNRAAARRRRRALGCALPLVLGVLLGGCASIPTSGPVRQGRDLAQEPDPRLPRSVGRPPVPGADAETVVRGFLQSGADFLDDHRYAREYLAPAARARWTPGESTSIYDRATGYSIERTGPGRVVVTATEVARIDEDGRYHRVADRSVRRPVVLARVDGEWRITDVRDGLLLSTSDIESAYRQVNLYFLAPTSNTVVPDPVLLADLPGLTTKVVTRLLQGPTGSLRGAVETAFPQATRLEVGSVPVRDGLATVRLDAHALQADPDARVRMSAQIVWTLRQLSDVSRIRILADGDDLVKEGVAREQPTSAWASFDPEGLSSSAALYVVRGGRVGQLADGSFKPAAGAAGAEHGGFRHPAVSLDGARIAVTDPGHRRLLVGDLASGAVLTAVPLPDPAPDLSGPSWDRGGDLWVVDRRRGRLLHLSPEADRAVRVPVPGLGAGPLQAVRVAREGTRVAVVAGTGPSARCYVGAIARDAAGGVEGIGSVREVLPDLRGVRDLAWVDAQSLVVLGSRGEQPLLPLQTDTDGFDVNDGIDPQRGLVEVAGAPAESKLPLVAATGAGEVQQWDPSLGWLPLGAGRDPAYPG